MEAKTDLTETEPLNPAEIIFPEETALAESRDGPTDARIAEARSGLATLLPRALDIYRKILYAGLGEDGEVSAREYQAAKDILGWFMPGTKTGASPQRSVGKINAFFNFGSLSAAEQGATRRIIQRKGVDRR